MPLGRAFAKARLEKLSAPPPCDDGGGSFRKGPDPGSYQGTPVALEHALSWQVDDGAFLVFLASRIPEMSTSRARKMTVYQKINLVRTNEGNQRWKGSKEGGQRPLSDHGGKSMWQTARIPAARSSDPHPGRQLAAVGDE